MSDDPYKAGLKGLPMQYGMDQTEYNKGVADAEKKARAETPAPKVEVDGVSYTMILMAPFLAVMYPTMGLIAAAGATVAGFAVAALGPSQQAAIMFAAIFGALATLYHGYKAEHALSRFRIYRVVRHVVRLILLGLLVAQLLMTEFNNTWTTSPIDAFNQASGGAIFAAIVAVFVMHWLFRRLDRVFFPVRDSYVISQERKYGGLSDEEIFAIKNAKFRGIRAFTLTWLAATAVLAVAVPGSPVALWLAVVFIVLWLLRGRLFFKLHRQRLADAEISRAASHEGQATE
jgi:hypothetical protein